MGFTLAFLVCAIGTASLFYLDRDNLARNSKALWLPTIWLWIIGSRPVSAWLGIWLGVGQLGSGQGLDAQLDGSPVDAVILMGLLAAAVAVLLRRKQATACCLNRTPHFYFIFSIA